MVIPASFASALTLLLLSLLCFSIWPNLYFASLPGRRFELFSLDFSVGAFLVALLAASTLGTFGSEMSFTDRMLIAGRAASVWLVGAGVIFALANMLFLVGIQLLGMAGGFAITFGTAVMFTALLRLYPIHSLLFAAAAAFLMLSAIAGIAGRSRGNSRTKGISLALAGGIGLGGMQAILKITSDPEFGPGPYATILMLSLGILIATPALDFFFMHIRIIGAPIGFRHYLQGGMQAHRPGVLGGAIWAAGALAWLLALSATVERTPGAALDFLIPVASVLVCMALGVFGRTKGPATNRGPRLWLFVALAGFAAGWVLLGMALAK